MKVHSLIVNTGSEKYPIMIGSNLVSNFSKIVNKNSIKFKKCLIIVYKNVPKNRLIY